MTHVTKENASVIISVLVRLVLKETSNAFMEISLGGLNLNGGLNMNGPLRLNTCLGGLNRPIRLSCPTLPELKIQLFFHSQKQKQSSV